MSFQITTFYHFAQPNWTIDQVEEFKQNLIKLGRELRLRGLLLLGPEGINATVSGSPDGILAIKSLVREQISSDIMFKDSSSLENPFIRFKVQIRDEIVTMGTPGWIPPATINDHLPASEFHAAMKSEDVITLDTRNAFEVGVGKFENAIDFGMTSFSQFPQKLKESGLPKDKKFLIYCTGGIRCEKAILTMKDQGYENVFQLQGGILKYLEDIKEDSKWKGECFVFDRRIAVTHDLEPSARWALCPHCGTPAEHKLVCARCDNDFKVCVQCKEIPERHTCSKNCMNHLARRPGQKGPQQRKPLL